MDPPDLFLSLSRLSLEREQAWARAKLMDDRCDGVPDSDAKVRPQARAAGRPRVPDGLRAAGRGPAATRLAAGEPQPCLLANSCGFFFILGVASPTIMSMLGDVVDENELRTGKRQAGLSPGR